MPRGKFRYPIGYDEIPRRIADTERDLKENSASVVKTITPMVNQMTQMRDQVVDLTDGLDQRVQESIDRNSYTRAEIDAKDQSWNWGTLAPSRGGTGTTNAYGNLFTVGPWRATWALSDGTLGTSQSSRKVKTDITDADQFISIETLRACKWVIYRMIDDLNLNGDSALPHLGMIAEDLDDAGLGWLVEYDDQTLEPVGISYPMLGVAALRLAQDAEDRIDALEQRINQFEKEAHDE